MKDIKEINEQYGITCAKLGDLVFRYEKMGEEIEKVKLTLHNINVDALKFHQSQEGKPQIQVATTETTEGVVQQ